MTTLIPVTSGRAIVAGHNVAKDPDAVRRLIGVIPQALTSDPDLTLEENLAIYAKLYSVPRAQREKNINEVLEAAGLEVVVVNGRHVQNVPGRKTDMADCQWLATLHAHGLLRGGFVPPADIRQLQDYQRLRADHLIGAASQVQKMQQALERMNIKFHDVISDLVGVSGLKVVRAILQGERRPGELLALCDVQIQKQGARDLAAAFSR